MAIEQGNSENSKPGSEASPGGIGSSSIPSARRSNRGFASMDPQRQREIASEGGRAAHEKGTAHEFTSEEARAAGRKGGQARSRSNRARSEGSTGTAEK